MKGGNLFTLPHNLLGLTFCLYNLRWKFTTIFLSRGLRSWTMKLCMQVVCLTGFCAQGLLPLHLKVATWRSYIE